ncbi:MAG: HlyD family efflux transporter periplasmic adaptor subunit [Bacteroidia bacterium]|nr:HlyD family efflux transporter periplasmic adaptor subunit [Bacteroidia bacterium]
MRTYLLPLAVLMMTAAACDQTQTVADAYGTFEAREIMVSAENGGRILRLAVEEGQWLPADTILGLVDTTQLFLRKKQLQSSLQAVLSRRQDVAAQMQVFDTQLSQLGREKVRIEKLLADGAATSKQLDDLNAQMAVVESQKSATLASLSTVNRGLSSETEPILRQIEQVNDLIHRSLIVNPQAGEVLAVYAESGEMAAPGKPLYKTGDTKELYLRAYVSADQLATLKTNQQVQVQADAGSGTLRTLQGTVIWISPQAEFTPKIIQTREERVNLVYAIKIKVVNDGYLKIGMPGEATW